MSHNGLFLVSPQVLCKTASPVLNRETPVPFSQLSLLSRVWAAFVRQTARVMLYLSGRLDREHDPWLRQDLEIAWNLVKFADLGIDDPWLIGFCFSIGRQPSRLVWWWRDVPLLFELAHYFQVSNPQHLDDSLVREFLDKQIPKKPPQSVKVVPQRKKAA